MSKTLTFLECGMKASGGEVGGSDDPMLDARQRLLKRLKEQGKKLEDVIGEGKGKEGEPKNPPIKAL